MTSVVCQSDNGASRPLPNGRAKEYQLVCIWACIAMHDCTRQPSVVEASASATATSLQSRSYRLETAAFDGIVEKQTHKTFSAPHNASFLIYRSRNECVFCYASIKLRVRLSQICIGEGQWQFHCSSTKRISSIQRQKSSFYCCKTYYNLHRPYTKQHQWFENVMCIALITLVDSLLLPITDCLSWYKTFSWPYLLYCSAVITEKRTTCVEILFTFPRMMTMSPDASARLILNDGLLEKKRNEQNCAVIAAA